MLVDLSEEAIKVCKQNVRRNDLNARVTCTSGRREKATRSPVLWDFDVIACNPLYPHRRHGGAGPLGAGLRAPHGTGWGEDGLDFYGGGVLQMGPCPPPGGSLLFEVGYDQARG